MTCKMVFFFASNVQSKYDKLSCWYRGAPINTATSVFIRFIHKFHYGKTLLDWMNKINPTIYYNPFHCYPFIILQKLPDVFLLSLREEKKKLNKWLVMFFFGIIFIVVVVWSKLKFLKYAKPTRHCCKLFEGAK